MTGFQPAPFGSSEPGSDPAGAAWPEPVLGWRLWRLRPEGLQSWAAGCYWTPGVNSATCLSRQPCPKPPGGACKCGFWALFSPTRCLALARRYPAERLAVLGLVQAWGEVALHGEEGFRAASSTVVALFTDWVWDLEVQPRGRAQRWWRSFLHAFGGPTSPRPTRPDPTRDYLMNSVAGGYGVPVLSLRDALGSGFLGELGVDARRREEVRQLVQPVPGGGGASKDSGPGHHDVSDAA